MPYESIGALGERGCKEMSFESKILEGDDLEG